VGHPGTYWYVQDYLERTDDGSAFGGVGAVSDAAARATHEEYVAKYGEDKRRVPDGGPGAWRSHYDRAAFVEMGVADPRGAAAVEERARDDAARRGWAFEKLAGELLLVKRSSTATGVPRTSSCCGRASAWPCRTTRR